jgi:protein arginine N-methyltransferase 1
LSEYERAIAACVREGDVVLDLGTGSGLLALLACRAGCRRVYAVDSSAAVKLGGLIASSTEFADRIEFIQSESSQLTLLERVDVIIADIHDTFGLQPGGVASLVDARDRLLRPGGIVIPHAIQLLVAPVEAASFYTREIDIWSRQVHGIDVSAVKPYAVNHVHAGRFDADSLLSGLASIGTIDLGQSNHLPIGGTATVTIRRGGVAHGLCGCFVTTLAADVRMGNVPGDSGTTNFAQAFFPFERPVSVAAGDEVSLAIDSHDGLAVRWRAAISRSGQPYAQFDHSTLNGLLVSPSQLRTLGAANPGTVEPASAATPPRRGRPAESVLPSSAMADVCGRLRVHPSVLSRELAGETVLLNLESGVYYGLDAIGTRAWNLFAEERSIADVCSIMLDEFDVSQATLEEDLTTLVRELCDKQLLVPVLAE